MLNRYSYLIFKNDVIRRAHVSPSNLYLAASDERLCGDIETTVILRFGS